MQAGSHTVHCHNTPLFAHPKGARHWLIDPSTRQACQHIAAPLRGLCKQRRPAARSEHQSSPHQRPQTARSAIHRVPADASSLEQLTTCFNGPELPDLGNNGGRNKPLPTQKDAIVEGPGEGFGTAVAERDDDDSPLKGSRDLDYLAELIAMQQNGPKEIGFFGTRNMGWMHQQLIEVLSYAMVLTGNHIYTSGATGTNAAVIRGALRAEKPDLLTVVLPQSLSMQPPESQELLAEVKNVVSKPEADHLSLVEASRICNQDIVSRVKQVICFAFHDSRLLLETCREASEQRRVVALFYLD